MSWQQVFIQTHKDDADLLSDELMALGSNAVTFLDSSDQPIFEPAPGVMPLWDNVTLVALFEESFDLTGIHRFCDVSEKIISYKTERLDDQPWERAWMDEFKPMCFGGALWIVPSHAEPPEPEAVNLFLDPGLAFGTGTHPTTAMCLEYLAGHPPEGLAVVDFGCGSGVLAIAALKLGATKVYAIDNDPQALEATQQNAIKNKVDLARLEVLSPEEVTPIKADCVLANILAKPLIELSDLLSSMTSDQIILSGILSDQVPSITNAYTTINFQQPITQNDWCLLIGHISV